MKKTLPIKKTGSPQNTHQEHPNKLFNCCLGNEPTPLSHKIQQLREQKLHGQIKIVTIKANQKLTVEPNMIVGDLIASYPLIKVELQEIHPLGLLSPTLNQTTLEFFLADLHLNLKEVCQTLTKLTL